MVSIIDQPINVGEYSYNTFGVSLPSVSLRAVLMSSSLAKCLWSAPRGIVGIVVFEVEEDSAEVWAAAAAATFDDSDGGNRGLQGE